MKRLLIALLLLCALATHANNDDFFEGKGIAIESEQGLVDPLESTTTNPEPKSAFSNFLSEVQWFIEDWATSPLFLLPLSLVTLGCCIPAYKNAGKRKKIILKILCALAITALIVSLKSILSPNHVYYH